MLCVLKVNVLQALLRAVSEEGSLLIKISQVFHREAFAGLKLRGLRGLLLFL